MKSINADHQIIPNVIRRHCGGWLATTPKFSPPPPPPRIGVTAATEAEARDVFQIVMGRWLDMLSDSKTDP